MSRELTLKQTRFCQEYIIDGNATRSAITAGYKEDNAYSSGAENLKKPQIRAYIDQLESERAERTQITADKVLVELKKLAFADAKGFFTQKGALIDIHDLHEEITKSIQSIEVVTKSTGEKDENGYLIVEKVHKIRMVDKKASLELLAKHLHLLDTKTIVEGKVEHSHNHTIISDETRSILTELAGLGEDTGNTSSVSH